MGNMAVFARSLHLGRFAFAALFLFLLGDVWASCTSSYYGYGQYVQYYGSDHSGCSVNECYTQECTPSFYLSGTYYANPTHGSLGGCSDGIVGVGGGHCKNGYARGKRSADCYYETACTSQCDVDSIACVNSGKQWVTFSGGTCDGKGCLDAPDSSLCDEYREMCQKLGGEFSGTPLEDGCSATCNTCGSNAQKKILEAKSRSCCNQGLAPEIDEMCYTTAQSGLGMTVSTNANLNCSDPSLSDEALQSYVENCANPNPESSNSNPGSSGDGSSSVGDDTTGLGYDYYPILDTIRDSLVDIRKNVETITTCLLSPNACAGLMNEGDTVIVNASDSTYIKQLGTKLDGLNSTLDTSVQNSSERLGDNITHSISASTDSLIDSMRKYMGAYHGDIQNMDSANRAYLSDIQSVLSQIQRDSSGAGRIVGKLDSALGSGSGADTSGVSYDWLQHGEALGDSIVNGSGYGGLDFEGDSLLRDSLLNAGYICNNDSCCIGSQCVYFDSDSLIEDSLTRYISRMGDSINQKNTSYLNDSTTALFSEVQDSLKAFNPLGIFDSTMLNTLGAKIPNTNTCPEHCSRFQVDIPFFFGTRSYTIDFGLCLGRSVFADGNVLSFLRFIIRLIVAITCITAVMWNAARIRR